MPELPQPDPNCLVATLKAGMLIHAGGCPMYLVDATEVRSVVAANNDLLAQVASGTAGPKKPAAIVSREEFDSAQVAQSAKLDAILGAVNGLLSGKGETAEDPEEKDETGAPVKRGPGRPRKEPAAG